eukprot:scaffold80865_cov65-Phaeocystis_antarctica.AAC.3
MCNWLCLVGMWSLPGKSCIAPPRPVEARCACFALVRTAQARCIREPSGRALSGRHSTLLAVRAGLADLAGNLARFFLKCAFATCVARLQLRHVAVSSGSADRGLLRLLWAKRSNTAIEARFVRLRRNVAVSPGRARRFRRRLLRTKSAGLTRHRTDPVAVPDSRNNHLDNRAEAGKQGRAVWRHARGSLAAEAEATLSDYTEAS